MNRSSQRGMALVITLIMLAVVTVMAVVFLGVSRRERGSVTVSADLTDAKLAADMAFARAEAAVVSRIAAQSNLLAYDLMVSTNLLNPAGFQPGVSSFTNVNYLYANGAPLSRDADIRQNLTNLFYDPRPPVYVPLAGGGADFRYYLDLNRNGRFDTNGLVRATDRNGVVTNYLFVGDPEWIGILEHPDQPHSSSNRFIARFAYVVLPSGKTLDINYIHNSAKNRVLSGGNYIRNLGAGSWEINLAAFLRDLTPDFWRPTMYNYSLAGSGGTAFDNAASILSYRYNNKFNNQRPATQVFFPSFASRLTNLTDVYSDGPIMTGTGLPKSDDNPGNNWSGSDNINGYVNIQELFDSNKTSIAFTGLLNRSLTGPDAYDRNTFSRLMAQLGTDSLPANRGKLNLNYDNVDANGVIVPQLATNLTPWTPLRFFTNAVPLLLQSQFGNNFAPDAARPNALNIPVWPTNRYSGSVHRMLQLAANIWDAGTTNAFPSVFRPVFANSGTSIAIVGYTDDVGTNAANLNKLRWVELNSTFPKGQPVTDAIAYGVPFVIGAKKGFPNFNELHQQTSVQVTRRLEGHKTSETALPPHFDVSYEVGVSNFFGIEAWNSYASNYPRALRLTVTNRCSTTLRDNRDLAQILKATNSLTLVTNVAAGSWVGGRFGPSLSNLFTVLPDSFYLPYNAPARRFVTNSTPEWDRSSTFPAPDWSLAMTNRLQFILVDTQAGRLIDFLNLDNMVTPLDIGRRLAGTTGGLGSDSQNDPSSILWQTNRVSGKNLVAVNGNSTMAGITNQIYAAATADFLNSSQWTSYSLNPVDGEDKLKAIDKMRVFLGMPPVTYVTNPPKPGLDMQVPYTPTRKLDLQMSWQVNDPLVHYHLDDLFDLDHTDTNNVVPLLAKQDPVPSNLGLLNDRYRPWGKVAQRSVENLDLARQDPMIRGSEDWNFPTNQYPGVGWLGRVHRGTPWQTVYLKSAVEPVINWAKWSGQNDSHPTNDWWIVNLFTTAPNDNAARGLLSVNQTNTAAWSAVLSGVSVLSNSAPNTLVSQKTFPTTYTNQFIQPASLQLLTIVSNINAARLTNQNQAFHSLGQILASPALTLNSPFLNVRNPSQARYGISDEVYERIPQQILSLLKEDEPFVVIYAYGQSLKPASRSIVAAPGVYQNLCTNYQITGEYVTKTAVRFQEKKTAGKPSLYNAIVESYNVLPPE